MAASCLSKALIGLIFAAAAALPAAAVAAEKVDLLLVLAADVSRSVDSGKFQLQRDGYATAISDPRVLEAISSGRNGRIGLSFIEWSGAGSQRVLIDWTRVGDAEEAKGFGDHLLEAPRSFADRTSISGAIDFSMGQFAKAPFESERRTIDISGGVTNNGLVILSETPLAWNPDHTNPQGGLDNYYRSHVVGGTGAFVIVAENFASFGQAIIKKLIAEIASSGPAQVRHASVR